jgi:hypothetical protein
MICEPLDSRPAPQFPWAASLAAPQLRGALARGGCRPCCGRFGRPARCRPRLAPPAARHARDVAGYAGDVSHTRTLVMPSVRTSPRVY